MNWDHFRYLLALARAGTLSGAARRLGVDQTTVARRLAQAEEALGFPVFDRADGRFEPTGRGAAVLDSASNMEIAAEDAQYSQSDGGLAGSVRVTAVPWMINRVLTPAYDAFAKLCPAVTLSLLPDAHSLSLIRREADIALRLSRPDSGAGVVMRRVGRVDFVACAPARDKADDLPWIGYDEAAHHLPQAAWIAQREEGGKHGRPAGVRVADIDTAIAAIRAGIGRSLLPAPLIDSLSGVVVADSAPAVTREIWMMIHGPSRNRPAVAAAAEWLMAVLRRGNFA